MAQVVGKIARICLEWKKVPPKPITLRNRRLHSRPQHTFHSQTAACTSPGTPIPTINKTMVHKEQSRDFQQKGGSKQTKNNEISRSYV